MSSNEDRKDETLATVQGASSPVKTPLAEPIFLLKSEKLNADKFEAYRVEPKNGRREVVISHKKGKNLARPIHLTVTRLDTGLFRIEVDEPLENGEYVLTPEGSAAVFGFSIY